MADDDQIYENYSRRSTEGLSITMIGLWLVSGIFFAAYLMAEEANLALLFQWHIVNTFCCVIAGQWYRYRSSSMKAASITVATTVIQSITDGIGGTDNIKNGNDNDSNDTGATRDAATAIVIPNDVHHDIDSAPSTSASFTATPSPLADIIVDPAVPTNTAAKHINGISNGVAVAPSSHMVAVGPVGQSFGSILPSIYFFLIWVIIYWIMCLIFWKIFVATWSSPFPLIVGSILPSVGLVVGFIPQVRLILRLKSSQGFSRGLSILDFTGCTISVISLAVDDNVDGVAMLPYAAVIICQVGMLILTTCIYPVGKPPIRYVSHDHDISSNKDIQLEVRQLARDQVAHAIAANDNATSNTHTNLSVDDVNGHTNTGSNTPNGVTTSRTRTLASTGGIR
jgi:hypothetical protein